MIRQVIDILREQKLKKTSTDKQLETLHRIITQLRKENINDNFEGTLEEIHSYIKSSPDNAEIEEFVKLHQLNISRWIEELTMLTNGGGAVTIDYQQRKGREI